MNAGSDDITVFGVHGDALVRRQIVPSGGAFPVSITTHGNLVYVLNARDGGSVQGYLRLGDRLVKIPSWHRNLGLDAAATPEFTHTPGQVAFSPDGSKVLVTTKAGGQSIDVFDVSWFGDLSATPVVNDLPGAVPFAITFDRRGHVVAAEAGPSAVATFTLTRHGRLTPITSAETGQAATCWIVGTGSHFYASNAGSGTLTGYRNPGNGYLPRSAPPAPMQGPSTPPPPRTGASSTSKPAGQGPSTSSESTTTARSAHSARCSSPEASAPKESPRPDANS